VFLASLVVAAIRRNESLSVTGLDSITCPIVSCVSAPEMCSKGQQQICKKSVIITCEHNGHNKVATIFFYYQHSNIPREGYVKENDLGLKFLISRGIITI
jgi:hypothetical protein